MKATIKPLTQRPAWKALAAHYKQIQKLPLRKLFAEDAKRGQRFTAEAAGLFLDFSKNCITDKTLKLLLQLADESGLREKMDAMFSGAKINVTENRAVLHVALRAPKGETILVDGKDVVPEVHAVLDKMAEFSNRVRSGKWKGHTGKRIPKGNKRMGSNPHANGGLLLRDLIMPDFHDHAVTVPSPGANEGQDTMVLGKFLRDVEKLNPHNFRVFGPDETLSNLLGAVFEVTNRQWDAREVKNDEFLAPSGRVLDSMLSEHQCEGWLEGYLLTGRHGLFNSYEAFIRIVDSMFSQHAKWLKVTAELPWRRKIASLNYLLASHVWQQDHNGFTHQDPGFLDHVINKKADIVRVYLPADANCLLSIFDHCLRSRHYVNVVVAGKHPLPQWLTMDAAVVHCTQGIGIWQWASNDQGSEPDVVMACCGDTPTLETMAAVSILREHLPELKVRVINVVDLMKLQPASEHPHGLSEGDYDSLFTKDKHIIFNFHGYPWLVHKLTYRRTNRNLHVRGYKEEGTITTPFDMRVQNEIDRFHLVKDVVDRVPNLGSKGDYLKQQMKDKLIEHKHYVDKHGQDLPEIRNWKWGHGKTSPTDSPTKKSQDGKMLVPELNRIKGLKNADSHK
jgi:xylulose-5-phosphate/fructose-6-phosphate phosphoketolase